MGFAPRIAIAFGALDLTFKVLVGAGYIQVMGGRWSLVPTMAAVCAPVWVVVVHRVRDDHGDRSRGLQPRQHALRARARDGTVPTNEMLGRLERTEGEREAALRGLEHFARSVDKQRLKAEHELAIAQQIQTSIRERAPPRARRPPGPLHRRRTEAASADKQRVHSAPAKKMT